MQRINVLRGLCGDGAPGLALIVGVCVGGFGAVAQGQTNQTPVKPAARTPAPAGSGASMLNRTKTKLKTTTVKGSSKTPAKDNASKPNGGIKPTGQNRTYADPVLQSAATVFARRDGAVVSYMLGGSGDGVDIGPVLRRPGEDVINKEDVRQTIIARAKEKKPIPTINEIRDSGEYAASRAEREQQFEATRQQYLAEGYMEGEIDDSRVVFIKTNNWCKFHMVLDDIKNRYTTDTVPYTHAPDLYYGSPDDDSYYRSDFVYGEDFIGGDSSSTMPASCNRRGRDSTRPVAGGGVDSFVAEVTLDHPLDDGSEVAEPLTPVEEAVVLLQSGDSSGAIKQLQAMLKTDAEDGEATRLLGLALLRSGKLADGIARMYEAYTLDPSLAAEPIDPDWLKDGAGALRDMSQRVVAVANKSKDADASVVAAALFQGQGKNDVARRMMDRAREKGLKGTLADEFEASLGTGAGKAK